MLAIKHSLLRYSLLIGKLRSSDDYNPLLRAVGTYTHFFYNCFYIRGATLKDPEEQIMHSEGNKEDDEGFLNIRRTADFIRISFQKLLTCRGNSEDANLLLQGPKVRQEGSREMGLSVHLQKKDAYPLRRGLRKLFPKNRKQTCFRFKRQTNQNATGTKKEKRRERGCARTEPSSPPCFKKMLLRPLSPIR